MKKTYGKFISDLYMEFSVKLTQQAYRLTGSSEKSEELMQEVFLLALTNIEKLYEHPCPSGWLFKTLGNLVMQDNQKNSVVLSPLDENMMLSNNEATQYGIQYDSIRDILPLALSEDEKMLLIWRFDERLSYEEIAERLGIEPSACGMRLLRAKKRCRNLLEKGLKK